MKRGKKLRTPQILTLNNPEARVRDLFMTDVSFFGNSGGNFKFSVENVKTKNNSNFDSAYDKVRFLFPAIDHSWASDQIAIPTHVWMHS